MDALNRLQRSRQRSAKGLRGRLGAPLTFPTFSRVQKRKIKMTELLTEEEKIKLKAEAEKELEIELKKKAKEDYKAAVKSVAKKKELMKDAPERADDENLVPVFISLPKVAECIRIDGRAFHHGRTYHVTEEVRATLLEIMGRGEQHEESLMDKEGKQNAYRRKTNLRANNTNT